MTTSKTFEVSRKRLLLWVGQSSLGNTQGVSAMPETLEGSERASWRKKDLKSASKKEQDEERDGGTEEQKVSVAWQVSV